MAKISYHSNIIIIISMQDCNLLRQVTEQYRQFKKNDNNLIKIIKHFTLILSFCVFVFLNYYFFTFDMLYVL